MKSVIAAILLLVGCAQVYGQASEDDRRANTPIAPFRIAGNIYYVGAAEVTSFLVTTPKGHILIDGGFVETLPQIEANVAKLGFKLADIKILLNTQAHSDHAGPFAELKKRTGAKMVASALDKVLLENGGKDDFTWGDRLSYEPVKVDRIVGDGDTVDLGGVRLRAVITPGHTKGCTAWVYEMKDGGRKYKVLFFGSASSPGYVFYNNKKYPGINAHYGKTFNTLKKIRPDYFLASHGSFFDLLGKAEKLKAKPSKNPFIDPEGYKNYVIETEKTFREKLAKEKELVKP